MFITAFKILIFCHFTDDGSCKGAETFELKKLLTSVRDKIIKMLPSHTGLFRYISVLESLMVLYWDTITILRILKAQNSNSFHFTHTHTKKKIIAKITQGLHRAIYIKLVW